MSKPKYLIQERKGQKPFVYGWTPVLAKKKDMRPITVKEAKRYIDDPDYRGEFENEDFVEDLGDTTEGATETKEDGYVSSGDEDETDDKSILDELDAETTSPVDGEEKNLEVTQGDLLDKEIIQINRFKKKASVEEYMLRKYSMPMLMMDELDEMKQQAAEMLGTLAATESLYFK